MKLQMLLLMIVFYELILAVTTRSMNRNAPVESEPTLAVKEVRFLHDWWCHDCLLVDSSDYGLIGLVNPNKDRDKRTIVHSVRSHQLAPKKGI